jgi:hypothetical protein
MKNTKISLMSSLMLTAISFTAMQISGMAPIVNPQLNFNQRRALQEVIYRNKQALQLLNEMQSKDPQRAQELLNYYAGGYLREFFNNRSFRDVFLQNIRDAEVLYFSNGPVLNASIERATKVSDELRALLTRTHWAWLDETRPGPGIF